MEENNLVQTDLLSFHDRETLHVYEDVYARDLIYKDLDLRFRPHALTGNINPLEEVAAVKRALYNLVMTETKERPFNMNFGTPLAGLLFNLQQLNALDLEDQIQRSIELFEPRVLVRDIVVSRTMVDQNAIEISIFFTVLNVSSNEVFEVKLKRTR